MSIVTDQPTIFSCTWGSWHDGTPAGGNTCNPFGICGSACLGHWFKTMTKNQDDAAKTYSGIIFIVDDDPDVRRAITRLLKMAQFRVETFATAEEFLSSGHSPGPGVLFLDIRLPGMNGVDLQKALADSGSTLPIVFMTAYEDAGVRQEVMDRGAVAFLQKPVEEGTLLEAIRKASDRQRNRATNLTGIEQLTN